MRKIVFSFLAFIVLTTWQASPALALSKDEAIEAYTEELQALGMEESDAGAKAEADVDSLIRTMEGSQRDVDNGYNAVEDRVDSLNRNDGRKNAAENALDRAKSAKNTFTDLSADDHIFLQEAIGGALPAVTADDEFLLAQEAATQALSDVNRVLIAPDRPGAVPTGDIVSDFIPQIIRQLFRFAWVAILVALTISGVMFVIAHDNEEKITKAKSMIYFSLVGFAFIALAFAIVKAVTDIDFFRFI